MPDAWRFAFALDTIPANAIGFDTIQVVEALGSHFIFGTAVPFVAVLVLRAVVWFLSAAGQAHRTITEHILGTVPIELTRRAYASSRLGIAHAVAATARNTA